MGLLMAEFRDLAKPLFSCKNCNTDVSGIIFNSIGKLILYQNGYNARKKFDEKDLCPQCFRDMNPELLIEAPNGDAERYVRERQQAEYDALTPEEKAIHDNKKAWKKRELERTDCVFLNCKNSGRKHYIDKYTYVTDNYLSNILSAAFESGIYGAGIWARIIDYKRPISLDFRTGEDEIYRHIDYVINGGSITLWSFDEDPNTDECTSENFEYDKDCVYELTLEKLIKGFELAYAFWNDRDNSDEYKYRCLHDQDECDGELADCIIQFAVFGDIVFG